MRSFATLAFVLGITSTWAQQIAFQQPLVDGVEHVEDIGKCIELHDHELLADCC